MGLNTKVVVNEQRVVNTPQYKPVNVVESGGSSEKTSAKTEKIAGRNDPCPCGSGKKYKNCCGK